jgi:hypothetical protein
MSFFFRHKFLSLFIMACVAYWVLNPWGKFGYARQGIIIFSKVPTLFFDIYIDENSERTLLEDLGVARNLTGWCEKKIQELPNDPGARKRLLLVGTGFGESPQLTLPDTIEHALEQKGFYTKLMPSPDAVKKYNDLKAQKQTVAILLRILH